MAEPKKLSMPRDWARFLLPLRRRVLSACRGRVRAEAGRLDDTIRAERVAVIAHYSELPVVSRSTRRLVAEFAASGYLPVVVSAATSNQPLYWGDELPAGAIVLRKPNIGYDFGSWAVALATYPTIADARFVVLANDSLLGPFTSLQPLLRMFEDDDADIWGLTDNEQFLPHLQSYFLGFRGGVLRGPEMVRFWSEIRHELRRWDFIRRYELGLTPLARQAGLSVKAAFPHADVVGAGENPVLHGWLRLLDLGFPFVKREVLWNPAMAPGSEHLADVLSEKFDARLEEWR